MFLIVGLGNPGLEYHHTRHNIGFDTLDELAGLNHIAVTQSKFSGYFGSGLIGTEKVILLKPQTFMNLSGKSVVAASQFYSIPPEKIIVIHDELDLELGQIKIKKGGGHGGHNGLRDITKLLGNNNFLRIRLGIGRPEKGDVTSHVLGKFRPNEQPIVEALIRTGALASESLILNGLDKTQLTFHSSK